MDIIVLAFFLAVSSIFSFLGFASKSYGLGGLGAIGFVLTGFYFITSGIDVQTQYTTISNFSAQDNYSYSWNATYNTSRLDNVTTLFNKTATQGFQYYKQLNDDTTRFIALLIIFSGIAIGFDAFLLWSKTNEPTSEAS